MATPATSLPDPRRQRTREEGPGTRAAPRGNPHAAGRRRARRLRRRRRAGPRAGPGRTEHPLEIIAEKNWHSATGPRQLLTLDWLVEWLAGKLGVPYLHIDPLKIDLTAVTQTMTNAYAERYRILPVEVTRTTLTVATAEPFVRDWADELEKILKLEVKLVFANPQDIRRYLGEFYNLARSMKKAQEASQGRGVARARLRAAGRARPAGQARRQRQPRRPHRRLALAIRVRAARLRHPRRAAARRRPGALSHRRRAAPGLRDPDAGAGRDDVADQAPRADGDRREAPPAGRPDQDGHARAATRSSCGSRRCRRRSARRS